MVRYTHLQLLFNAFIILCYLFLASLAQFVFPFLSSGPRLFKEPSAKSNKPIIQNAIAHCCLAGKVNEAQKNAILEVSAVLWQQNVQNRIATILFLLLHIIFAIYAVHSMNTLHSMHIFCMLMNSAFLRMCSLQPEHTETIFI